MKIKRIYEHIDDTDGYRVLVDRLWPRGISKENVKIDEWQKDLAPSTELRKWFNHEADKFEEFKKKYQDELKDKKEVLERLKELSKTKTLTLLYAAKNERQNQAVVLLELLRSL